MAASIHLSRDGFNRRGRCSSGPRDGRAGPCGDEIAGVERLADGLTNAVYRVTAIGSRESLAVRVFANHHESLAKETAVLDALNGRLPVPERLTMHPADRVLPHACLIYHWIPGITLNKCRQQHAPAALESLGAPIAVLLATHARCPLDIFSGDTRQRLQSPCASIAATLGVTFDRLQRDRARSRLGRDRQPRREAAGGRESRDLIETLVDEAGSAASAF